MAADALARMADLERFARELDWNLLRSFLAVAEAGGVTRAAERLRLAQPTVSGQLKRLERQIGRPLVERGGPFRLTAQGETLRRAALAIQGEVSRLAVALRESGDAVAGHVAVATASHVVSPHFDRALADFHARHPQVTFEIDVTSSAAAVEAVARKARCAALCLIDRPPPGLEVRPFFREFFGFFCGRGHSLYGRRDVSVDDLRGQSFVSFRTEQLDGVLRPIAEWRARHDVGGPAIGVSSNLEEVRRMIGAGLGVGALPLHVAAADVGSGALWRLPPYGRDETPAVDVHLATNPRAALSRAEAAFVAALHAAIDAAPMEERVYFPADDP